MNRDTLSTGDDQVCTHPRQCDRNGNLPRSRDEWFDFDLSHYQEQLVNGRIQMTPEAELRVFMPDIDKIPRTAANSLINPEWMKNRNLPPPDEVTH